MQDICLNCGAEHEYKRWGAKCLCDAPNVVHQAKCDGCGKILGYIIDDDYCAPEKLYCSDCVEKARQKQDIRQERGTDQKNLEELYSVFMSRPEVTG